MAEAHDVSGPSGLEELQDLVSRLWLARGGPPVSHHIGDLPWRLHSVPAAVERDRIRVWRDAGAAVAWGWFSPPDKLELVLDVDRDDDLVDEILAWGEQMAGGPVKVDGLDTDTRLEALLARRGYEGAPEALPYVMHALGLEGLEPMPAIKGYRLRVVSLPDDLERRVDVHRAAFGTVERPSRVTPESYGAVAASWPYEPELDWVAEADDGSFAAFCLVWPDDANGVGLLEPVGTHHAHRRRGLARGVCLAALAALRARGAATAIVTAVTDEARAFYRSLGFVETGRYQWFTRAPADRPGRR